VFSVPVAFVASMSYCAFLAYVVRAAERPRRLLYWLSLVVLSLLAIGRLPSGIVRALKGDLDPCPHR